jgi:hypothetical protein
MPTTSIYEAANNHKNRRLLVIIILCLILLAFRIWEYLEFSGYRETRRDLEVHILRQSGSNSSLGHNLRNEARESPRRNDRTEPNDVASEPNDVIASGTATNNAGSKIMHPKVPLLAPQSNHHIVYSNAALDRSGSAITDMLAAHAYAFHQNMTYGGACLPEKVKRFTKQVFEKRIAQHQALIDAIGLNGVIAFVHCSTNQTASIISKKRYIRTDAFWYTPKWLDYMHQHIDYPLLSQKKNNNNTRLQVAVHVRRADIQPCNRWSHRYLPNSYYQRILDKYLVDEIETAQITIYSEKNSFQPMTEFSEKNYTLKLDTELTTVWRDIMTAEFVVLSCSAFSYVPALLNPKARVIYTDFHLQPLAGWEVIRRNSTFMKPAQDEVEQLKKKCTKRVS